MSFLSPNNCLLCAFISPHIMVPFWLWLVVSGSYDMISIASRSERVLWPGGGRHKQWIKYPATWHDKIYREEVGRIVTRYGQLGCTSSDILIDPRKELSTFLLYVWCCIQVVGIWLGDNSHVSVKNSNVDDDNNDVTVLIVCFSSPFVLNIVIVISFSLTLILFIFK